MFYTSILLRSGNKIVTFKTKNSECYTTLQGEMLISESPKQSVVRILKHHTGLSIDESKFYLWSIERQDDSKFWMYVVDISKEDVDTIWKEESMYKPLYLINADECPHPQSWVLNTYIENSKQFAPKHDDRLR